MWIRNGFVRIWFFILSYHIIQQLSSSLPFSACMYVFSYPMPQLFFIARCPFMSYLYPFPSYPIYKFSFYLLLSAFVLFFSPISPNYAFSLSFFSPRFANRFNFKTKIYFLKKHRIIVLLRMAFKNESWLLLTLKEWWTCKRIFRES